MGRILEGLGSGFQVGRRTRCEGAVGQSRGGSEGGLGEQRDCVDGGHVGQELSRQGTGGTETAGAEGLGDQGCLLDRDPGRTSYGQGCQMVREQSQAVGRGMEGRGHRPGRWGYRGRQPEVREVDRLDGY